jgi:hypothetical protein
MITRIAVILSLLFLVGCMKTMTLENGKSKVPIKSEVYKNRSKFDRSLLSIVDTSVVYKYCWINGKTSNIYGVYRFYPEGQFNEFIINGNRRSGERDFDPKFNGYRGVYYLENNRIRYDEFGPVTQNRRTGKLTGTFSFKGDTLFVIQDTDTRLVHIYLKHELPPECMQFKADW